MEDLSSFNITWDDQTERSNLSSPLPQTRDVFWDEKILGLPFQGHSSAPHLAPSSNLCIVQESSKREKKSLLPESGALDSVDGTTDFQGHHTLLHSPTRAVVREGSQQPHLCPQSFFSTILFPGFVPNIQIVTFMDTFVCKSLVTNVHQFSFFRSTYS
jgi:hypothetical protein